MDFLKKHMETFSVLILLIFCYFLFFYKMGNYPLIDVDETRYVAIAKNMINLKDWLTLRLNTELFLEKPPLYFWLLNMSFLLFGKINEVTARIPVGLCASFSVLIIISRKKLSSFKLGLFSALTCSYVFVEFGESFQNISVRVGFVSTFCL
jgi:4-amino-4-deoxy-L-arabinose transferase-like glycosyltransferase